MTDKEQNTRDDLNFVADSLDDFMEKVHDLSMSKDPLLAVRGRVIKEFMPMFQVVAQKEMQRSNFNPVFYTTALVEAIASGYASTLLNLSYMHGGIPSKETIESGITLFGDNVRAATDMDNDELVESAVKAVESIIKKYKEKDA